MLIFVTNSQMSGDDHCRGLKMSWGHPLRGEWLTRTSLWGLYLLIYLSILAQKVPERPASSCGWLLLDFIRPLPSIFFFHLWLLHIAALGDFLGRGELKCHSIPYGHSSPSCGLRKWEGSYPLPRLDGVYCGLQSHESTQAMPVGQMWSLGSSGFSWDWEPHGTGVPQMSPLVGNMHISCCTVVISPTSALLCQNNCLKEEALWVIKCHLVMSVWLYRHTRLYSSLIGRKQVTHQRKKKWWKNKLLPKWTSSFKLSLF